MMIIPRQSDRLTLVLCPPVVQGLQKAAVHRHTALQACLRREPQRRAGPAAGTQTGTGRTAVPSCARHATGTSLSPRTKARHLRCSLQPSVLTINLCVHY